jgi:hypothetical protein
MGRYRRTVVSETCVHCGDSFTAWKCTDCESEGLDITHECEDCHNELNHGVIPLQVHSAAGLRDCHWVNQMQYHGAQSGVCRD